MNPRSLPPASLATVLDQVLKFSARTDWRGHDKHDGLNSRMLWATCGWNRTLRLLALQAMMRSPIDLRPLLAVPKVHNPKGLALFMQAFIQRWRLVGNADDLEHAQALCVLLQDLRCPPGQWSGQAWGYQYPWQDLGFFAPRAMPNAVVTCFVCEALLDLHEATGQALPYQLVEQALPFLCSDLPVLHQGPTELCLGYMPIPMKMRVMDVSILIGALLARFDALSAVPAHTEMADRLLRYVLGQQTAEGAWWYTDPPSASPVRIDNYHTGFILDALWRYMHATGNFEPMAAYDLGLEFYAKNLFEADGAPRWMSDQRWPHDIHGSAQGILTFCRHNDRFPDFASRIAAWAIDNLYNGAGAFWYRQTRWRTQRTLFLRWNNGWMARALADLQLHLSDTAQPRDSRPSLFHGTH